MKATIKINPAASAYVENADLKVGTLYKMSYGLTKDSSYVIGLVISPSSWSCKTDADAKKKFFLNLKTSGAQDVVGQFFKIPASSGAYFTVFTDSLNLSND
jgi:hypothetical protein